MIMKKNRIAYITPETQILSLGNERPMMSWETSGGQGKEFIDDETTEGGTFLP